MSEVKHYNKEVFKVGDIVNVICPMCDGRGGWNVTRAVDQFRDEDVFEVCFICYGEGYLEKELRECPHCNNLVSEDVLTWVHDRYGILYKVCWDCYGEVVEEISHYEYDYMDAGEYLDEDY